MVRPGRAAEVRDADAPPSPPRRSARHALVRRRRTLLGLLGDAAHAARVAARSGGDGALVALVEGVLRGEAAVLQRALRELRKQRVVVARRAAPARGRAARASSAWPGPSGVRLSVCSAQATWHWRSSSQAAAVYAHCGSTGAIAQLPEGRQLGARPARRQHRAPPRSAAPCACRCATSESSTDVAAWPGRARPAAGRAAPTSARAAGSGAALGRNACRARARAAPGARRPCPRVGEEQLRDAASVTAEVFDTSQLDRRSAACYLPPPFSARSTAGATMIIGVPEGDQDPRVPRGHGARRRARRSSRAATRCSSRRARAWAAGIPDAEYERSGAKIVETADEVWERADMIVKVKEPHRRRVRADARGPDPLHLLPPRRRDPQLTKALLKQKVAAVAYETIQLDDGQPARCSSPMSEVAGTMAIQVGRRPAWRRSTAARASCSAACPACAAAGWPSSAAAWSGTNAAKIAVGHGRRGHHPRRQPRTASPTWTTSSWAA